MGNTCLSAVKWIWHLSINWNGVSAVATLIATGIALFLPLKLSRQEWSRQNRLRQEDAASVQRQIVDVRHEVCSAVDRVLAYREATIALFDSAPVYNVGIEAIRKILANTEILAEVLNLLKERTELSDGAIFSAVAGQKIADVIIREAGNVLNEWGVSDPRWLERKAALEKIGHLASITKERITGVRKYNNLAESQSAKKILEKYLPLSAAIKGAIAEDTGEPANHIADNYY